MGSEQAGFFQVVSSSQKMGIPKHFVSQVGGSLGNRWFLRDIHCHSWSVEVSREGNRYYLRRGWSDFYKHNSLQQGDVLVFECRKDNLFDFKNFGPNACENGQGHSHLEEELEKENVDVVVVDYVDVVVDDDDDDDVDVVVVDDDDDDDDDDDEEDIDYNDEDDEEEEEDFTRPNTTPRKIKNTLVISAGTGPSKRKYKKKNVHDIYGAEIFKSGLATRPNNPYFVSRSRTLARKNELYIPKDVIVDYHLMFPEKLFLVDEQGRKWSTKVKQWKDGRVWCTKGWKSLCRVNNIDTNDICICEFVQGQGQCDQEDVMCMRVRRVATV